MSEHDADALAVGRLVRLRLAWAAVEGQEGTVPDLARELGTSPATLRAHLGGHRGHPETWGARGGAVTLAALEVALGVRPGALADALDGDLRGLVPALDLEHHLGRFEAELEVRQRASYCPPGRPPEVQAEVAAELAVLADSFARARPAPPVAETRIYSVVSRAEVGCVTDERGPLPGELVEAYKRRIIASLTG